MKKYSLNSFIMKLFTVLFLGLNFAHAYKKQVVCTDPGGSQKQVDFAYEITNNMARTKEHTSYILPPVGLDTSDITELAGPNGEIEIKKISNNKNTDFLITTMFGDASFVRFYQKELVYIEGTSEQGMDWQFYKLKYANEFLSARSNKPFQVQLYPGVKFGPQPPQWHILKGGKEVSQDDWWVLWQGDRKTSLSGEHTPLICQEVEYCEPVVLPEGAVSVRSENASSNISKGTEISGFLQILANEGVVSCTSHGHTFSGRGRKKFGPGTGSTGASGNSGAH
ncbi:MAG: hypothetical protein K0R14_105 [Burkholderiales bacterium]|nr:hypothetical protein [Burkholderiales bacterium]